jgi:hypothetical protein
LISSPASGSILTPANVATTTCDHRPAVTSRSAVTCACCPAMTQGFADLFR